MVGLSLDECINNCFVDTIDKDVTALVLKLAHTSIKLSKAISQGAFSELLSSNLQGSKNKGGDVQKKLDVYADELFMESLHSSSLAVYASEESDEAILIDPTKKFAVLVDPLDGSSNINTNISIGTIFSVLLVENLNEENFANAILQEGRKQLAAGFVVYGPQTALVLAITGATHIFYCNGDEFICVYESVQIPQTTQEFAINASNSRHWSQHIYYYVQSCLDGSTGIRSKDFNMRWVASLVAEIFRVLIRGGIFLYPSDERSGYSKGKLRIMYECNPMALIIENAGGKAISDSGNILDIKPKSLHQRIPTFFGSSQEVSYLEALLKEPLHDADRSPLFNSRGLFRKR